MGAVAHIQGRLFQRREINRKGYRPMKPILKVAVFVLVAALLYSQTNPSGSSFGLSNSAAVPCQAPSKGMNLVCSTTGGFMFSIDGAPYAGIAGTQGPPGPPGPTGPP